MLKKISEAVTPIKMGGQTINITPTQQTTPTPPSPVQNQQMASITNKVQKAISESGDLITALEAVGAMYGIPPSNIIADDTATSIRVVNDNIIAPPMGNPSSQTKSIVCAIGAVLDFISQRVDDKLNTYQMNNINTGRIEDSIANANPAKGKCIGRYEDDEGGEILAYDTGFVDMPNTPAARAKVTELRASNTIPTFDPSPNPASTAPTYFTEDEDDISTGVDMDAGSNTDPDALTPNNVADAIQESAYHINMIAKLGDTTHLGYDLLRKHGFDFVKPIDSVIQESSTDNDEKKKVRVTDIKHMKFDNTNIIKAVEYFNKARDAQDNAKNGSMDLDKFINDPNYEKAIGCLNKQFDCRINLRFFKTPQGKYENTGTVIYDDLKKKLTVSKSKGFQLGGLPIEIMTYNHYFENSSPKDIELFGQSIVSTICHEIFHNIAFVLRKENVRMGMSLTMALHIAANAKTVKDRRIILTNYVDSLEEYSGKGLFNRMVKRKIVKQLMALTTVHDNEALIKEIQKSTDKNKESSDKYIDELIKKYKKNVRQNKPTAMKNVFPIVGAAASIITMIVAPSSSVLYGASIAAGFFSTIAFGMLSFDISYYSMKKTYDNSKLYEEYYCDLFASMYKLPKFFFIGPSKKGYVSNDFNDEKIKELAKLEKEYYESIFCRYPTDLERTYAGVKIAKKLLKDKDLDPSLKKYCQWIVDNFSNVTKSNIDEIYNKTTFDPKEAEDLDKHLEDLIKDNNIVLTESFKQWLSADDMIGG